MLYDGVCHTNLYSAKGQFGPETYPLVPVHELFGEVTEVG